ncbi:MAG: polysaccharide biosynthesis C-terminal domain-containing protein [Cyclobacteriaceae bacterium]
MGIIRKQAVHSSIYIYLGVFLGFANAAMLMPFLLTSDQIGIISLLAAYTNVFSNLFAFGLPLITIKLFPKFKEDPSGAHHGFFSFSFILTIVGSILGIAFFFLIKDQLISGKNTAAEFEPFVWAFAGLFVLRLVFKNFDPLVRMLHNTVLGSFGESFLLKFLITLSLLLFWHLESAQFELLFILYTIGLSSPGIVSMAFLILRKQVNFQYRNFLNFGRTLREDIASVGFYGLLGSVGGIIVLEVDKIMVGNFLGTSPTGIYTTAFFFGVFVSIPSKAIKRVSAVVVSGAWHTGDIDLIKSVYYKSCLNQFIFAVYLFLGVWLNIDYVFEILPSEYAQGKYVVLFIGLAHVFDMLTGANNEIISSSKFYKLNTYFTASLIILVVLFNYLLIPPYGISGAALASCLALIIINVGRYFFLNRVLKYQPLDYRIILVLTCGLICYGISTFLIPVIANPYFGILIHGGLLTAIFLPTIYFLKVSEDINELIGKYLRK